MQQCILTRRYFHIHIEKFGLNDDWEVQVIQSEKEFEYNVREISENFMLYHKMISGQQYLDQAPSRV